MGNINKLTKRESTKNLKLKGDEGTLTLFSKYGWLYLQYQIDNDPFFRTMEKLMTSVDWSVFSNVLELHRCLDSLSELPENEKYSKRMTTE